MKQERPNGEDMLRDCERDCVHDNFEDESEDRERCTCPYCECLNKTDFGICQDCANGAHQG